MNTGLMRVIRWLALATLVVFAVAFVAAWVLPSPQGGITPLPGCPGSDRCFPIFAVLSIGTSSSLVVVTLCLVLCGLFGISVVRRSEWLAVFALLALLLVLSPTLWLFLRGKSQASYVIALITAVLVVISLLAVLAFVSLPPRRGANTESS